jgi:phosphoribosylanthranilate isomerase
MYIYLMIPRIKICCIRNQEEANLAIRYGASAIGLVGAMPSGPGPIEDKMICAIAKYVPPPIGTFLLTCELNAHTIIAHHKRTQTNTIQIVDELNKVYYPMIRDALPNVKLVQVIHVRDRRSVKQAMSVSEHVDAILLDSGNPKLPVKELGGTGKTHDWTLSREIREKVYIPVFLAGGLNASNVRKAIEIVEPWGVDVCSGVRTNGMLDEKKLDNFIREVHRQ